MKTIREAVVLTVLAALLPLSASATEGTGAGDPDVGTSWRGTGVLSNFKEHGANLVRLHVGAFDPLAEGLPRPPGLPLVNESSLPDLTPQYWLVQVNGQRFDEVYGAVRDSGGEVAVYAPDDTYLVRATPLQRELIGASPAVRWAGYYQPAWKLATFPGGARLADLTGEQVYRVYLFRDDPQLGQARAALRAIPGVEVVADGGQVLDLRATAAQLQDIASVAAVEYVGLRPEILLHNANARWVTDTGVRDLFNATTHLTGAGQTAAVADTAINYTYDLNGRAHVAFRDCDPDGSNCKVAEYTQVTPGTEPDQVDAIRDNNTGHRKMVAFFDLGDTGPNPFDESSHGSHTAGSVDGDQPPFDVPNGHDGMAPAAMHVHQNIGTPDAGLTIPTDLYDLFRQAYRPRNPADVLETSADIGNPDDYSTDYVPLEDARTHNNSWGSGILGVVPPPDAGLPVDQFVWDHEDMAIVFSAGNDGPGAGTLGSPALAKNDITSGASANGRQPMASIDSMAQFSSHGPSTDGRFGPDLATPGQIVVSVKGGSDHGYHVAQGTSMSAPVLTGLSTLVRQYFFDGYAAAGGDGFADGTVGPAGQHNPSAALVKAAMANGAERMRGYYTGDDGSVRALDGQWPSAGQGFGRVDLDNSLYFSGDPTNNFYVDVYRGDVAGAPEFTSFPLSPAPATRVYTIDVEPGQPLDVTLAWTDAPTALVAGSPALVHDLNLTVTGPGGTYVGNNMNSRTNPAVDVAETPAGAGPVDNRNNTERIRIADPADGTYTITVGAGAIITPRQGFALAASGDIAPPAGSFTPGPPLQEDAPGAPAIAGDVEVRTITNDTAEIRFATDEPTTATATVDIGGTPTTFIDSYNEGGPGGFPGLNEGVVETSADYADKPVVGTGHEILLTGLAAGQNADVSLEIADLDTPALTDTEQVSFTTPTTVFGADSPDIGQCAEGEDPCRWHDATLATQLYASDAGGAADLLGAFMFRVPQSFDPSSITGAAVELTSTHNWVNPYNSDPNLFVDLLNPGVEPDWGTQDYPTIKDADADARVPAETTYKVGAYQRYAFTFACGDLQDLKDTLVADAGVRKAAFRYDATLAPIAGLFGMDFGFNRRSGGPDLRPRLVLYTDGQSAPPDGRPCVPGPAPAISNVGIHDGHTTGAVTVTWDTDVESDSIVLFREQGATDWVQVGTPVLSTLHQVEVFGLDPDTDYEFAVRSARCNGATSTDTNGGAGYDFFRDPPSPGPRTEHDAFDWETGNEGWTATSTSGEPPPSEWTRGTPGASDTANPDGSRNSDGSKNAWHVSMYTNLDEAFLTADDPVTFTGQTAAVEFAAVHDTEPTFDFLHVEYSTDAGANWTPIESIGGLNEHNPAFDPYDLRFPNPGGPVLIRFRFSSDELISFPLHQGVSVDKVAFASYPNTVVQEDLPSAGPVPPPSAGASGLTPPATHQNPTAPDLAAGTAMCGAAGFIIPNIKITQPDEGALVDAAPLLIQGTAVFDPSLGTPAVEVHATDGQNYTQTLDAGSFDGFATWSTTIDLSGQAGDQVGVTARLLYGPSEVDDDAITVQVRSAGGGPGPAAGTCPGKAGFTGNQVVGTSGNDLLKGGKGKDIICGLDGNDVLRGGPGNDLLLGGDGTDRLQGGKGRDRLRAGADRDILKGGQQADVLQGGPGKDSCSGGGGLDRESKC